MLNKRPSTMSSKFRTVKKIGVSLLAIAGTCTAAIAPNAFAGSTSLVDQTITAKFRVSDLNAENGTQTVYAQLEKKAKRACRADQTTLNYTGQNMAACVTDLMDQFVESANFKSLLAYHQSLQTPDAPQELAVSEL
ncbi:MAG: UrcA family protein [Alphaproteobacteria bacterium]